MVLRWSGSALSVVGFGDGSWQKRWQSVLTTIRLTVEKPAIGCGSWILIRAKSEPIQPRDDPHLLAVRPCWSLRGRTARPKDD